MNDPTGVLDSNSPSPGTPGEGRGGGGLDDGSSLMSTCTLTNRRLLSRLSAFVRSDTGTRRLGDEAFTAGLAAQKHLLKSLFTSDAQIHNGTLELPSTSLALL